MTFVEKINLCGCPKNTELRGNIINLSAQETEISRLKRERNSESNYQVRLDEDGRSQTQGTREVAILEENNIKEESVGKSFSIAAPAAVQLIQLTENVKVQISFHPSLTTWNSHKN